MRYNLISSIFATLNASIYKRYMLFLKTDIGRLMQQKIVPHCPCTWDAFPDWLKSKWIDIKWYLALIIDWIAVYCLTLLPVFPIKFQSARFTLNLVHIALDGRHCIVRLAEVS